MIILPLTYLGNIQYFSKLCFAECTVDIHEHYVKQSYRNRCNILAVNGVIPLVVNVVKGSNWDKQTVKNTKIDYSKRWQHEHRNSIISAYRNAPYFDYYWQSLESYYSRRFEFLFDLNDGLIRTALKLLGSSKEISYSEKYIDPKDFECQEKAMPVVDSETKYVDYRAALSSKPRLASPDETFAPMPYWQVFSEKFGFIPNLSIIDLLFCEGPASLEIIRSSIPGK